MTDVQKSVFFVDCPAPPNRKSPQTNQQTVCRKLKQISMGFILPFLFFYFHCYHYKNAHHIPLYCLFQFLFRTLFSLFFFSFSENDTVVIDRKCFWQEIDKPKPCENENLPDYIKVVSCELCDDIDGCNHSSRIAIQFGQIVAIMAIPLAIANSLSF